MADNARGHAMRLLAALVAFLMIFPAAFGENFVSNKLGFTADFPAPPVVGEPQDGSESVTVAVKAEVSGVYTAMVTVESYKQPARVGASDMQAMIKIFAAQLDATISDSKPGKIDGYKARFFTYKRSDGNATGRGIIVVVPAKRPRIYQVFSMYTPSASEDEIAALDRFLASFHLE